MKQPCYVTAQDYACAIKQTQTIIEVLRKSKDSLLRASAKMPDYWHDSCGDAIQIELVEEIEELIRELKYENS